MAINRLAEAFSAVIRERQPGFYETVDAAALLTAGLFAKSTFEGGHVERMASFERFVVNVRAEIERVIREVGEPDV